MIHWLMGMDAPASGDAFNIVNWSDRLVVIPK